ncbi:carboxypeptidase regulatory-like domain-containing protein [Hyphomonas sp.]|uniref:TonB-dependent receptor n=1 Tax=Hyphomonas sp. TaxID=87 RepID=UPI003526D35A
MINWNNFARGAAVSAIAITAAGIASAQVTTSSIRGSVVDETGAPVSGATVTVLHVPSGTVSTTSTNAGGTFSARGLRVGGPYSVSVTGSGIQPISVTEIYTDLDQPYDLDLSVEEARTLDTVVVTASQLQTGFSNEGLMTSLGIEALNQVVSIDRDITDAAELDPFASVNVQSGGGKELSIAGANNRFNSLTIDGVALNDRFGLNANGYPTQRSPISYDAIESLSVQTAPFDVEYNGFTGGTINAVTKSGTNEFHGSAFYYKTDDSMAGDEIGDRQVDQTFDEKTYGFTLGGPIIKDKLFFFGSYDKYEETASTQTGIIGSGAVNERDVTQAEADRIAQAVMNNWGFDVGGFDKSPVTDEKYLASIDWNINENHRAKFTYLKTEGSSIAEQNGNNFLQGADVAFSSSWYNRSETVESFIGHLFSDWTPNFSTEFKIAKTTQATGQDSLNGAEFFLGSVPVASGDVIAFGPDRFRHGNELDQEFLTLKATGQYLYGDHSFKFGYEREEVDVDNLFAQNSEGTYAFDSIDDLEAGIASALLYDNAITNNENDLRAIWGYNYNSMYGQDSWDVLANLNVTYGLRYDWYESKGDIRPNMNFFSRYGYYNTETIDGLDVVLPRVSFKWEATDDITVRGGIGRFSGGSPSVWISNSYSNDGVTNDGVFLGGPIAVPTTPDPVYGQWIPQAALDDLSGQSPDGSVNALDRSFDIPTTYKVNLGVAYNVDIPYLGDDWLFSADVLYNRLENTPYWYDARCVSPVSAAPDGRPVYDCATSSDPQSIVVGSVNKGYSTLFALSASKNWDTNFGDFDLFTSYTHADVKDIGGGTSSTASSNYSDSARWSYQVPTTGTSNFQVEHMFKLRADWEKAFFGDYATKVSLFATRRSGQPYSYTFNENNAPVFGQQESSVDDAGNLLYVPTDMNDPLFAATSFGGDATAQQAFFDYINGSELAQYKGGITERNGDNSRWSTIVDLRLQQELPGVMKNHKTYLFVDMENVGNFLNSDWGRISRTRYEYERAVVSARIVDGQYEYFNLQSDSRIKNEEDLNQSLWQVQLGIRYEF